MTSDSDQVIAQLDVDRKELLKGLRLMFKVHKPSPGQPAILKHVDGQLWVRIGGKEIGAKAVGHWPGEARASSGFLLALLRIPPPDDPVTIRVRGDRLRVGSASVTCQWQEIGAAKVTIPVGASFPYILHLGMCHSDEVLEQSGVLKPVKEARARRERLIEKALETLHPFDITYGDIDSLVDERVRSMWINRAGGQD